MNLVPVQSSNLAGVGYDASSQSLYIEFLNGGLYQYHSVPSHVHSGLMNASSHGQYFDQYVKKAGYKFTKIR